MAQKSKDEVVDGPRIAAQILNRMKPANKERIMQHITTNNPHLAQKISDNVFSFEDIADLTPQGAQLLIKEVEHKDLIVSLKSASDKVKGVLFANMSERKAQMVREDLAALPPTKLNEIEDAQRRIIVKLDELRTAGLIRTESKHDIWV